MNTDDPVANRISELLNGSPLGEFKVETRTDYAGIEKDSKSAKASVTFVVTNPALENDPLAQNFIMEKLAGIPALAENVRFESEEKHAQKLAGKLREFANADSEHRIPDNYVKWFEQQAKSGEPAKEHALAISKNDTGITVTIDVPKGNDPNAVAKNIEARIDAIKDKLASRTVKYTPQADTEEKKQALKEKVKALDVAVTTTATDFQNSVTMDIRSSEQLDTLKKAPNAYNVVLSADQSKSLRDSNPLMALKDGDGKSAENPAHLQKALARSVLFAGDKAQEIFPIIAGREDMKRAVAKTLVRLKKEKPDLAPQVDSFLNDDIFKKHERWQHNGFTDGPNGAEAEQLKSAPRVFKRGAVVTQDGSEKYTPGKLEISLDLPADKFKDIMAQLAAPAPTAAATLAQAADQIIAAGEQLSSIGSVITGETTTQAGALLGPKQTPKELAAAISAAAAGPNTAAAVASASR